MRFSLPTVIDNRCLDEVITEHHRGPVRFFETRAYLLVFILVFLWL